MPGSASWIWARRTARWASTPWISTNVAIPRSTTLRRITARREAGGEGLHLQSMADTPAGRSVARLARQIERSMGLRDYWSVDLRVADDGTAWFLEFEVCPAVTIYDFLTYLAEAYRRSLPEAIARATTHAYRRRLQARSAREP